MLRQQSGWIGTLGASLGGRIVPSRQALSELAKGLAAGRQGVEIQ